MNKQKELIMRLSDAFGPSGMEDEVVAIAKEELSDFHVKEDRMRNLYIEPQDKQNGVNILLDAHMDEVGFIIQAIKPNGMLRFLTLGSMAPQNIVGSKIWIKNLKGDMVEAICVSKPPHFMSDAEKNKPLTIDDLLLDVGASSKEEVEQDFYIGIGAFGVPATTCRYHEAKAIFMGKAFDDRIGCAAVIQTLKELPQTNNYVHATLTSQEEVGTRGMTCAIHNTNADIAICFEGCPADDSFSEPYMIQAALKKGPMLRHFDVSMITSPRFQRYALDLAKKLNIPVQESVRKGGGTNGRQLHTAYFGIPTIVIGIPVRYAHSGIGIMAYEDYRNAIELAKAIIQDITVEISDSF